MRRPFVRSVSVLLVAILAILASADVLCLRPCESVAAAHHESAGVPAANHCGGVTPPGSGEPAMAASGDSCAGQHAWNGPAADRTGHRPSVEPVPTAASRLSDADRASLAADGLKRGSTRPPPGTPARTSPPLRI